ncbi:hypothetical+protein [Methylocapsa aurea]|uniref:hypothetical protein n=1 Tax=Methylocapsa aurea TaxID=663610 RepID=UPI003D188593
MQTLSHRPSAPLPALDTETDGLVTAMGATLLVAAPDPADRAATMLHLHRQGFRAGDVSRLAERAIDKARELRRLFGSEVFRSEAFGETLGAIGLALTWASIVALACLFDPGEAQAHVITAPPAPQEPGVAIWPLAALFGFAAIAVAGVVVTTIKAERAARELDAELDELLASLDGTRRPAPVEPGEPEADADYANITAERQTALDASYDASRYDDILAAARMRKLEAEVDLRRASLARSKAIGGAR